MPKLTPSEIKRAPPKVRGWRKRGPTLNRTFEFKDFPAAMKFTNAVARLAEKAWHHPDIDIRWNIVRGRSRLLVNLLVTPSARLDEPSASCSAINRAFAASSTVCHIANRK